MKKNISLVHVEHIWSVLCTSSSLDEMTKNISLFNVLEQLNLKKDQIESQRKSGEKIVISFPFQIVSLVRKIGTADFKGNLKVEIIDPNNEGLGIGESELKFQDNKDRFRTTFAFPGIPITIEGYYYFKISLRQGDGQYETVGEIPLQVVFS